MRRAMLALALALLLCACQPRITEYEPRSAALPLERMIFACMTVEEQVGQLFLARCPTDFAAEDVRTYHLGGYLLFGRDFRGETPETVRTRIASFQDAASVPLLIAVDEEGGTVTRVSRYPAFRNERFPSPREMKARGGLPYAAETEREKAALLHSLGINVNLAPVCDLADDPRAFLYPRSYGGNAQETAEFVAQTVAVMKAEGMGSVLKHFPGYGNNADTHVGAAVDRRTIEQLSGADLLPFASGIRAGCDAILVSHTVVTALDGHHPASLSPKVQDYLRNTMGFSGVTVTDDLMMRAVRDSYGVGEAAVLAVLAGNDLLCSSEYRVQYPAVLQAVREGRIPKARLEEAVLRILKWKRDLGLL